MEELRGYLSRKVVRNLYEITSARSHAHEKVQLGRYPRTVRGIKLYIRRQNRVRVRGCTRDARRASTFRLFRWFMMHGRDTKHNDPLSHPVSTRLLGCPLGRQIEQRALTSRVTTPLRPPSLYLSLTPICFLSSSFSISLLLARLSPTHQFTLCTFMHIHSPSLASNSPRYR